MSAAGEAAYGGGVEKGLLQQFDPDAILYMHNGVAYRNLPETAAYQLPASGNAAAPAAAPARSPGATGGGESFNRKRRHPRKYAPDGVVPLAIVPPSQTAAADASPPKKMGRLQKLQPRRAPLGGGFIGLKPHIFTVQAGEDVASKVMSFSYNGWAVCILSANGAVSNVTLHQGDSSGGTVTYEGPFEILSLAGSYLLSDNSGLSSRTDGLSVSLAGPDDHVLGGSIAGPLTAASPVQVVLGSFLSDGWKEPDFSFAPGRLSAFAPSSYGSPPNTAVAGSFNTSNQSGFPNFPQWK